MIDYEIAIVTTLNNMKVPQEERIVAQNPVDFENTRKNITAMAGKTSRCLGVKWLADPAVDVGKIEYMIGPCRLIIGLGHRRGAGKNTVAELMRKKLTALGYNVVISSFAKGLKDIAYQLYSWGGLENGVYYDKHYDLKEVILPKIGKSPRTIWIEISNKMRDVHPQTWINNAIHTHAEADIVIFADARYPNEMDAIHESGGLVFKVYRPSVPFYDDIADSAAKNYIAWDGMILNEGTVEELDTYVDTYVTQITSYMWSEKNANV